jgi:hypothetical protein
MLYIRWGAITAISALIISVTLGIFSGVNAFHIFIRAAVFAAVFFGFGFGLRFIIDNFFPELLLSGEDSERHDIGPPGSHINITVDSFGEYAVPELYKTPDDSQELGNIESLISGVFKPRNTVVEESKASGKKAVDSWFDSPLVEESVDLKKEEGYNNIGSFESVFEVPSAVEKPPADKPQFSPSFGDDLGLGGLPDLDMMARAFSSGGEEHLTEAADYSSPPASVQGLDAPGTPFSFIPSPSENPVENLEPEHERYIGNKPQPLKGDFAPKDLAKGISTILKKG